MKILIAEDDATSRRILERKLTRWGYEFISVTDGNAAIELLMNADTPKLVLLDWMMPGKDGLEVCRIVRQIKTDIPPYIILLTAKGDKDDIAKGLEAGANDYVVKPYHGAELNARIKVGQRMIQLQYAIAEKEKFQGVLEMAGAVCHEFNQPLTSISVFSSLILKDTPEDNPHYETLNKIQAQVYRLGEITKKLMHITKYRTKTYQKGHIVDIDEASQDGLLNNGSQ